jgi:putative glutathione S-transferase
MRKVTPQSQQAWTNAWYDTASTGGRFVRTSAQFRNWITIDGEPGPTGSGGFAPDSGRYHLFMSLACPWAHRTLLARLLLRLESHITISNAQPYMGPDSWRFDPDQGRLFRYDGDEDEYVEYLYELYRLCDSAYDSRATVPVLWDKQRQTIVSNESAEILRMFNTAFKSLEPDTPDLCPEPLRQQIDDLNEWIYPRINNGVYRAGFATTQEAYEEAVFPLFETLDELEQRLSTQRYLCGDQLTEADLRLFPTLVRFDSVYAGHFKCSIRRIVDYPNLWAYTRDIYQIPGVSQTVDMEYNKRHYYGSHDTINPTGVIPAGPELDFMAPHGRG